MNIVLLGTAIVLTFSLLLIANRILGPYGVIGFMGIATIMANIFTTKQVDIFGLSATLGTVMFASNFLATDILTESYGVKYARLGVKFAVFSAVAFMICTQLALAFIPNGIDSAQPAMETLFGFIPRISIASVVMFTVANCLDVSLYDILREKMDGRKMWLRNNVCTMLCNGLENFVFYGAAFFIVMPVDAVISMAITATLIEIVVALCDTPFLYIATRRGKWQEEKTISSQQLTS